MELLRKMFENGIWMRHEGPAGNRFPFSPPCIITMEEADKALDIVKPLITEFKPP